MHITTVGAHKAKAKMEPPANSHRRTESVWGGWEPTGMQRWLRMQCTAIYIYIYIYRIYTKQQWDPNKTPDTSFYTNTEQRRTNFFFFLISLIKKILFALFFVKVQLNQNRTSSEAFWMGKGKEKKIEISRVIKMEPWESCISRVATLWRQRFLLTAVRPGHRVEVTQRWHMIENAGLDFLLVLGTASRRR